MDTLLKSSSPIDSPITVFSIASILLMPDSLPATSDTSLAQTDDTVTIAISNKNNSKKVLLLYINIVY